MKNETLITKNGGAITHSQFQDALKIVNKYEAQLKEHYNSVKREVDNIPKFAKCDPETNLFDTGCSTRLRNILLANRDRLGIETSGDFKLKHLNGVSMREFLQCRIAGKKTLEELEELCLYAGIKLSV